VHPLARSGATTRIKISIVVRQLENVVLQRENVGESHCSLPRRRQPNLQALSFTNAMISAASSVGTTTAACALSDQVKKYCAHVLQSGQEGASNFFVSRSTTALARVLEGDV
jgi:hypothetical protein